MSNITKLILIWVIGFSMCFIIPPFICYLFAVKSLWALVVGSISGLVIATVCIKLSNKVIKL